MNYPALRNGTLLSITLTTILALSPFSVLAAQSTDTTSSDQSTTTLKGHVVEVAVTLNNLRDARLSISRVRKAAANLYDEMTRQEMTMGFNPDIVGTLIIMTPRPQVGPLLPARKKWVTASMEEIGPIIKLFKEDVDIAIESNRRTDVREAARESLSTLRTEAFEAVNASFKLYKQLEDLTAGATYDQNTIASEAKSLDKQMKELDRSLKKGISILQKDAKASKKSKEVT